jgi:hypothetical protein
MDGLSYSCACGVEVDYRLQRVSTTRFIRSRQASEGPVSQGLPVLPTLDLDPDRFSTCIYSRRSAPIPVVATTPQRFDDPVDG